MILKALLISISFFFAYSGYAQLSVDWYKNSGVLDVYNSKKSVYSSVDSCIYTTGVFSGQFEFDGASISTSFPKAFFLMKTKGDGAIVWLKKIAENNYNVELSSNVVLSSDSLGKLILGITFNGKLYHNGDSIILPDDAFTTGSALLKMDTAGMEEWHKQLFVSNLKAISVGNSNTIYSTGRDLNNDFFLMAHSIMGDSLWNRTGGSSSGEDIGENIVVNGFDLYVTGVIQPNSAVYFDTFHPTFVSPYFNGSFFAKYDINGVIQWVKCFYAADFGEMAWIRSLSICDNKIVLGGEFSGGLVKFFPVSSPLTSQHSLNLASVLICYDSSGNKIWVKEHHNNFAGNCSVGKIVNENGRCWILSEFSGAVAVDNQDTITSFGSYDLSIDLIDLDGNSLWNYKVAGANSDGATSFFKVGDDLVLNISTKSQSLLVDNATMTLAPVSDQMVLVRFNYETLGLSEDKKEDFTVFPNPNNGTWRLQSASDLSGKTVQIFSVSGELISEQLLMNGTINVISTSLSSGIYLVRIEDSEAKPIRIVIK